MIRTTSEDLVLETEPVRRTSAPISVTGQEGRVTGRFEVYDCMSSFEDGGLAEGAASLPGDEGPTCLTGGSSNEDQEEQDLDSTIKGRFQVRDLFTLEEGDQECRSAPETSPFDIRLDGPTEEQETSSTSVLVHAIDALRSLSGINDTIEALLVENKHLRNENMVLRGRNAELVAYNKKLKRKTRSRKS